MSSEWSIELSGSPKLMKELMAEMATSLKNDSHYDKTGRNLSVNQLREKNLMRGIWMWMDPKLHSYLACRIQIGDRRGHHDTVALIRNKCGM